MTILVAVFALGCVAWCWLFVHCLIPEWLTEPGAMACIGRPERPVSFGRGNERAEGGL